MFALSISLKYSSHLEDVPTPDRVTTLQQNPSPLIVLLGPTGAGKSDLGLSLAERFSGEIIGCDSIQVYRGLDIGSAKIPVPERRGIPHHLIDVLDLNEELTAGVYSRLAREVITAIHRRNKLPIVVGGTGFYLRALLEGLSPAPLRDPALRLHLSKVAARRPGALHRFLRARDFEAASRIHPNDRQKIIRAIELILLGHQPVTAIQSLPRNSLTGVITFKVGLAPTRALLYEQLDQRSKQMFSNGLLAETKAVLDSGVSPAAKPLQSLGYKQAVAVLTGRSSIEEAIRECQSKTRQYAKRQITWFRAEAGVHWLHGFGADNAIKGEAVGAIEQFLQAF